MNHSSKPMITTIIPTYRRPKLLRRAIRSVLNQTYPHLQVCVYDNASNDETASVVAEIAKTDSRVKYYCHPENIGGFANFIYGLKHVDTPFFSFFSDDDVLLPNFYLMAMKGFDKFPDAMFSAGSTILITDKGRVEMVDLSLWKREGYYAPPEGLFALLNGGPVWISNLFRKEVVKEVGLLDINTGALTDGDFVFRIAARFPIIVCKEPCAIFMIHDLSSCSSSLNLASIWPGYLNMIHNISEDKRIPLDARLRAEKMMTSNLKCYLFSFGFFFIKQKNFEDAYKIADILRKQYNQKTKAIIVYSAAKLFQHLPMGSDLFFNGVVKIRRYLIKGALQKQFGSYVQYLQK